MRSFFSKHKNAENMLQSFSIPTKKIVSIIALGVFFVFLFALFTHNLEALNQDLGRHIKTGEIIWKTKNVPHANLFSYTEPNHSFINHHWLSEVSFYGLHGAFGLRGLILFKALLLIGAFALLFLAVYKKASTEAFILASIFGVLIFTHRTDVRPEIFSYFFLSFFLFAILKAKNAGSYRWLYVLPLIQLLWVNAHIYFFLGPLLFLAFFIDYAIMRKKNSCFYHLRFRTLLLIGALLGIATFVNPHGLSGALAPFTILQNYGYSIVENQSTFFLRDYGILFRDINIFEFSVLVLTASFLITFARKHGLNTIFEIITAIIFTILGFKMIRNFGIYALAFTPIFALNLSSFRLLSTPARKKVSVIFYVFLIIVLLFLTKSVLTNRFYRWKQSGKQFGLAIPTATREAAQFVRDQDIQGPVFNNFDIGSSLIWQLYPKQKVFVDNRPEAYSVKFFQEVYIPMQQDPMLWKKYSEQYKINYIFWDFHDITPWSQKFLRFISSRPEWKLAFQNERIVIFTKKSTRSEDMPRISN